MKIAFSTFRPREAATISGLTEETQRDLRKRGLLPSVGGWADHSAIAVAEMLVVHALGRHKIGPQAAWPIAKAAAPLILGHAATHMSKVEFRDVVDLPKAKEAIFKALGIRVKPHFKTDSDVPSFAVVTDQVLWTDDVSAALDTLSGDYDGSAVVVDLVHLGAKYAELAGRPFIVVEDD